MNIKMNNFIALVFSLLLPTVATAQVIQYPDRATGAKIPVAKNIDRLFPLKVGAEWTYALDKTFPQNVLNAVADGTLTRKVTRMITLNGYDVFEITSTTTNRRELQDRFPNANSIPYAGVEYWTVTNKGLCITQDEQLGMVKGVRDVRTVAVADTPLCVLRGVIENEDVWLSQTNTGKIYRDGFDVTVQPAGPSAFWTKYETQRAYTPVSITPAGFTSSTDNITSYTGYFIQGGKLGSAGGFATSTSLIKPHQTNG